MKLSYVSLDMPFRYPFTISRGTKTHQPTLVVCLEHIGIKGYGEAPEISYYPVTRKKMIEDAQTKRTFIEKFAFTSPDRYWHYLYHVFPQNSFLLCALDIASWDLYGKILRKPLYEIWKLDPAKCPQTDYTIGIDTIEKMVEKIKDKPWPIYKIKLGTPGDLRIMEALRASTDALFRVDANAGWSLEEALEIIPRLKDMGVEFVEQPLAKENWEGMKILREKSVLPLIADESCVAETDVKKCGDYFHGINIKLTKCGGITPALRMISHAKDLGLKVMVGSMNETSIGTAAIAQMLPLLDYVDMDGPLLLKEDIAEGLRFENGKAVLTASPGLGIIPSPQLQFN